MKLASLEKYTSEAEKILSYWLRNRSYVVRDREELVGGIINILVKSDQSYDENLASLAVYRFINCDRFLKKYFARSFSHYKKFRSFSEGAERYLPQREENVPSESGLVEFLKNNSGLTTLEKEHLEFFLQGKSAGETAELFDTSRSNVYNVLKTSISKMKAIVK